MDASLILTTHFGIRFLGLISIYTSFSNYSFTGISLEADHCQSSEEVLAVAVAGLGGVSGAVHSL